MLFRRRNQLIGLDIGTHSVKVAEIVNSQKGYILKKMANAPFPAGLFKDGEPKDPGHVSMIIKDLFVRNKINIKNVAMSIGGYSAIVKPITINNAKADDPDLHKRVFEEAEHYIPFDISEVNIDFQVMGPSDQNPNQLSILLVAAKKNVIEKYVSIATDAGLNPVIMDIDAFAVQNIFELNEPDVSDAVLINVGANKISLNIIKEGHSVFMREVAMGASKITEEIMSMVPGISFEEAEDIKKGLSENDSITKIDIDQILASVSADWSNEIARAIDFFYSNYAAREQVPKIYICGGGSNISRFSEDLASHIGSKVELLEPLQVIHTDKVDISEEELEMISSEFCVALGLGLRKMDDK